MCEIYKCPSDQVVTFIPVKPWSLLELVRGVLVVIVAGIVRCGWQVGGMGMRGIQWL